MENIESCRACCVKLVPELAEDEIYLCEKCKGLFSSHNKDSCRNEGFLTRLYEQYFRQRHNILSMIPYKDGVEFLEALDDVEFHTTPSERNERLFEVVEKVRPIVPGFCMYDRVSHKMVCPHILRDSWINTFRSWCLPPRRETLQKLLEFIGDGQVLEVGAGAGLWARILRIAGVSIRTTDVRAYNDEGSYTARRGSLTYIQPDVLSADEAVIKYGESSDVLLGIWQDRGISKEAFHHFKGDKIISIGEGDGGCTAALFPDEFDCDSESEDDNGKSEDGNGKSEDSDSESEDSDSESDRSGDNESPSEWRLVSILSPIDWYGIHTKIRFYLRK